MDRPTKITFADMRAQGVRGLLIYCAVGFEHGLFGKDRQAPQRRQAKSGPAANERWWRATAQRWTCFAGQLVASYLAAD
jgi:hypothetical protein